MTTDEYLRRKKDEKNLDKGTSVDVTESPLIAMQISRSQFLRRRLHRVILRENRKSIEDDLDGSVCEACGREIELTRGGKTFSAARRGTENPPWVLVSLAVKVLQKNSESRVSGLNPGSEAVATPSSFFYRVEEIK